MARLYWYGRNADEIPFADLPDDYVIKATTGWCTQHVQAVTSGVDPFTQTNVGEDEIRRRFTSLLQTAPFSSSFLIAEELIPPRDDSGPLSLDFKAYVFNRRVAFLQVFHRVNRTVNWYTPDWIPVDDPMHLKWPPAPNFARPDNLEDLLTCSAQLASRYEYPFVRVDLYNGPRGPVFGEFTHTPYSRSTPNLFTEHANRALGELWLAACSESNVPPPGARLGGFASAA